MPFSESARGFDPTKKDMKARRTIPEHEMDISFARSGGKGGQNVNKRETKAVLRWHVGRSSVFSEEEKQLIRANLSLTTADEIVLHCDEERNREQNKQRCIERLHDKVLEAIKVDAPRVETKKSKGVKIRERQTKELEKRRKQMRRAAWE
jgi:ribosome-associated protein